MRLRTSLAATIALAVACLAADVALAQPYKLRRNLEPGQVVSYDRTLRTDTSLRAEKQTEKSATEARIPRQEMFVAARESPASALAVAYESPGQERLVLLEQNGKDALAAIPEEKRIRPRAPSFLISWQGPRGEVLDQRPADNPLAAVELAFAEGRTLPESSVNPGDTWAKDLTFGESKAKITTKFTEVRKVDGRPCAVLETTAAFTLAPDWAKRLEVADLGLKSVVPLDGGALVEISGSVTLIEKTETAEFKRVQQFKTRLVKEERLAPAQLKKAADDVAAIQKGLDLAKADKLDESIAAFDAFAKENPQGRWTEAVQLIANEVLRQKRLTKPMPVEQLRLALRSLQGARDNAATQGNAQEIGRLDQTLMQIATVNMAGLMEESKSADPVVRDLAAFGLTFARDNAATGRLRELLTDPSAQIRGTATVGLAIRNTPLEKKKLLNLLSDPDSRVRGGAVLLVLRTLKPDDPQVADILPAVTENLGVDAPWPRANAALALKALAPKGSVPASIGLVQAYWKETQANLKPAYLDALKTITGVDAKDIKPYEDWVRKQPGGDKLGAMPKETPAVEKPAEKPAEKPTEKPAEKPVEKPAAKDKAKPKG